MGGHKETRKSFGEVQEDLRRELLSNARSLLSVGPIFLSQVSPLIVPFTELRGMDERKFRP